MGMDLIPKQGRDGLHFNWSGWSFVREFAEHHGVPTEEFAGLNDGDEISEQTCRLLADAIEANATEWNEAFAGESYGPNPAADHAAALRASGGVYQL